MLEISSVLDRGAASSHRRGALGRLDIDDGRKQPEDDHEEHYQGYSVHTHHPFLDISCPIGMIPG